MVFLGFSLRGSDEEGSNGAGAAEEEEEAAAGTADGAAVVAVAGGGGVTGEGAVAAFASRSRIAILRLITAPFSAAKASKRALFFLMDHQLDP